MCLNQPPGFIPTMCEVPQTMFLYQGRTEAAKRAFSYRGAVMWNGLENELKDEINLNSFKSALS